MDSTRSDRSSAEGQKSQKDSLNSNSTVIHLDEVDRSGPPSVIDLDCEHPVPVRKRDFLKMCAATKALYKENASNGFRKLILRGYENGIFDLLWILEELGLNDQRSMKHFKEYRVQFEKMASETLSLRDFKHLLIMVDMRSEIEEIKQELIDLSEVCNGLKEGEIWKNSAKVVEEDFSPSFEIEKFKNGVEDIKKRIISIGEGFKPEELPAVIIRNFTDNGDLNQSHLIKAIESLCSDEKLYSYKESRAIISSLFGISTRDVTLKFKLTENDWKMCNPSVKVFDTMFLEYGKEVGLNFTLLTNKYIPISLDPHSFSRVLPTEDLELSEVYQHPSVKTFIGKNFVFRFRESPSYGKFTKNYIDSMGKAIIWLKGTSSSDKKATRRLAACQDFYCQRFRGLMKEHDIVINGEGSDRNKEYFLEKFYQVERHLETLVQRDLIPTTGTAEDKMGHLSIVDIPMCYCLSLISMKFKVSLSLIATHKISSAWKKISGGLGLDEEIFDELIKSLFRSKNSLDVDEYHTNSLMIKKAEEINHSYWSHLVSMGNSKSYDKEMSIKNFKKKWGMSFRNI
jgi:hypothetical protein